MKSFKVIAEKQEADKATIAVTIEGHQRAARAKPADKTMRYDFVREAGQWKIDDIKGAADGRPWSVRGMLAASLKSRGFAAMAGRGRPAGHRVCDYCEWLASS